MRLINRYVLSRGNPRRKAGVAYTALAASARGCGSGAIGYARSMETTSEFDLIIIGAGPGGEACAANAADLGLSVAVVERELIGGECAYWGCMPSKA